MRDDEVRVVYPLLFEENIERKREVGDEGLHLSMRRERRKEGGKEKKREGN